MSSVCSGGDASKELNDFIMFGVDASKENNDFMLLKG